MSSWSVDTFSCTSKEKQTKIIYTNVYVRRWGQTTPQRSDQSVTILVNLELLCFNSFLTKLGLKIRNIRPIKMAHGITSNVKLWRHIWWRHSYVNFKLLNLPIFYTVFERTIQGKLKAEKKFSNMSNMSWDMTFWIWINSEHKNGTPSPAFPLVK